MPIAPKSRTTRTGPQRRHRYKTCERGYDYWWEQNKDGIFKRIIVESGDPWCRICRMEPAVLLDHVVAPSTRHKPGTIEHKRMIRDVSNMQPLCRDCNSVKGDKPMDHPDVLERMR